MNNADIVVIVLFIIFIIVVVVLPAIVDDVLEKIDKDEWRRKEGTWNY